MVVNAGGAASDAEQQRDHQRDHQGEGPARVGPAVGTRRQLMRGLLAPALAVTLAPWSPPPGPPRPPPGTGGARARHRHGTGPRASRTARRRVGREHLVRRDLPGPPHPRQPVPHAGRAVGAGTWHVTVDGRPLHPDAPGRRQLAEHDRPLPVVPPPLAAARGTVDELGPRRSTCATRRPPPARTTPGEPWRTRVRTSAR
ncbi:tyrosinase [Streptomyces thinghirensis]|nr:tyrosinase [Streptomyces thinghirensis]